jgi:hypothetical protein
MSNDTVRLTVTSNIVNVILAYTTSLSGTYRTMFTAVNVMVSNSMACRLFRQLRFGMESDTSGDAGDSSFGGQVRVPLSLRRPSGHAAVIHGTQGSFNDLNGHHHEFLVSKMVQSDDERGDPLFGSQKSPKTI